MISAQVMNLLYGELRKAEKKFPTFPTDPVHAAAIVAEESGELLQAALDYTYGRSKSDFAMAKEAAHTAAMGIRFLMSMHQMERRPPEQR
ncbi:hypothetical protein LCGC14_2924380 [marine sediment metagenome]|uniref:NTP pyrophosphohydrolase MazG putative catalytic core domain-containing protein n=1 Tax=marine sediment metagenome TaxID=412755 RepID=A0A0F8ZVG0_9ZZZZ